MAEPHVLSLRRYPVKSMGGEPLDAVEIDERGLAGDRWYAVEDADGHFASGKNTRRFRRRDAVFGYAARTVAGRVLVDGPTGTHAVGDDALDADLSTALGLPVRVTPEAATAHQDGGQVSLVGSATLDWCAERWGVDADPRRLRVNIVVRTSEPFVEESWIGSSLAVGAARLRVVQRVPRCRTIDLDQDGATPAVPLLRRLGERDLCLAVYADVETPGVVRVGAPVIPDGSR